MHQPNDNFESSFGPRWREDLLYPRGIDSGFSVNMLALLDGIPVLRWPELRMVAKITMSTPLSTAFDRRRSRRSARGNIDLRLQTAGASRS